MKVLIAIKDVGMLGMFKLLMPLKCDFIVADNGVAALEVLQRTPVAFAIIDLELPLLGGIEVLQAIRASRECAALPVVMLGATDKDLAAQVLKLGVSDFLVKPFRSDQMRSRLMNLIASLEERIESIGPPAGAALPDGARPILVVDASSDYRYFVANVLAPGLTTIEVESGQLAINACTTCLPSAIIVGPDVGLFSPPLLVRKLRSLQLQDTRILFAGTEAQAAAFGPDLFDGVIARTFVPSEFTALFRQAVARKFSFADGHPFDLVRATTISATEQAIGMVSHTEVHVVPDGDVAPAAGDIGADTVLYLAREEADVHLSLRLSPQAATRAAARMLQMDVAEVAPEDAESFAGEVVNMIAGRVKAVIAAQGGSANFSLPKIGVIDKADPRPADVSLSFDTAAREMSMLVTLRAMDRRGLCAA